MDDSTYYPHSERHWSGEGHACPAQPAGSVPGVGDDVLVFAAPHPCGFQMDLALLF